MFTKGLLIYSTTTSIWLLPIIHHEEVFELIDDRLSLVLWLVYLDHVPLIGLSKGPTYFFIYWISRSWSLISSHHFPSWLSNFLFANIFRFFECHKTPIMISLLGSDVDKLSKFRSKYQIQLKTLNWIFKTLSHQEQMILSSIMNEKTYLQGFLEGVLEVI